MNIRKSRASVTIRVRQSGHSRDDASTRSEQVRHIARCPQSTIAIFASWSWHITHKPERSASVILGDDGGGEVEGGGGCCCDSSCVSAFSAKSCMWSSSGSASSVSIIDLSASTLSLSSCSSLSRLSLSSCSLSSLSMISLSSAAVLSSSNQVLTRATSSPFSRRSAGRRTRASYNICFSVWMGNRERDDVDIARRAESGGGGCGVDG